MGGDEEEDAQRACSRAHRRLPAQRVRAQPQDVAEMGWCVTSFVIGSASRSRLNLNLVHRAADIGAVQTRGKEASA